MSGYSILSSQYKNGTKTNSRPEVRWMNIIFVYRMGRVKTKSWQCPNFSKQCRRLEMKKKFISCCKRNNLLYHRLWHISTGSVTSNHGETPTNQTLILFPVEDCSSLKLFLELESSVGWHKAEKFGENCSHHLWLASHPGRAEDRADLWMTLAAYYFYSCEQK